MKILIIDIGGKSIKHAIFKDGKMETEIKMVEFKDPDKKLIFNIVKDIYENDKEIDGIAISAAGGLLKNSFINGDSAIKGLTNLNLIEELKKHLNYTGEITALNDANCAAYSDYAKSEKGSTIVTIAVGTGVGAGVIVNGEMIIGKNGFAGELGIMFTEYHLDGEVSGSEFTSATSGFYHLEKRYKELTGVEKTGKEIFDLYDQKNKNAFKVVDRMYKGLAMTIFNTSLVINPDCFYIGGGLSKRENAPKEIMSYIKKITDHWKFKFNLIKIKQSFHPWDGQLYGAYAYFMDIKNRV